MTRPTGMLRHLRPYRAPMLVVALLLVVAACSAGPVETQSFGYGSRYYQLGRD